MAAVPRLQPPMVWARKGPTFHGNWPLAEPGATKAVSPKTKSIAAASHNSHVDARSSMARTLPVGDGTEAPRRLPEVPLAGRHTKRPELSLGAFHSEFRGLLSRPNPDRASRVRPHRSTGRNRPDTS